MRSLNKRDRVPPKTKLEQQDRLIFEKNAMISHLQSQIVNLTNQLSNLSHNDKPSKGLRGTPKVKKHQLNSFAVDVSEGESKCGKRRQVLTPQRTRIGRNASIATANALAQQQHHQSKQGLPHDALTTRIMDMFKDPAGSVDYLNSELFAKDVITLSRRAQNILGDEPRCLFLQSPSYVFGDIHGNLEDLHFFSDNIWRLGMSLTAGTFVFLGDYVDRGKSCLECVAYLLAMKCLLPYKVVLLRGNHETRDVNGWEEHYGDRSFIAQCRNRFGDEIGYLVWEEVNRAFDRMPLSAVIDQDIFCVHGGIPRATADNLNNNRIQEILSVPKVAGINPPYDHEDEISQRVSSDCIWSDPASEDQEQTTVSVHTGFGDSLRGGGAICFGHKAVTDFLKIHDYSFIMRAHEAHAEGVAVSKGARVFTVFSTSKDHNQGSRAMAGCILVDSEKLQVINRSPAYKNQYVHRRDSVSLHNLTPREIEMRERVGLVVEKQPSMETFDEEEEDDEIEEEWEDMDDDECYTYQQRHTNIDTQHDRSKRMTGIMEEDEDNNSDVDDEDIEKKNRLTKA